MVSQSAPIRITAQTVHDRYISARRDRRHDRHLHFERDALSIRAQCRECQRVPEAFHLRPELVLGLCTIWLGSHAGGKLAGALARLMLVKPSHSRCCGMVAVENYDPPATASPSACPACLKYEGTYACMLWGVGVRCPREVEGDAWSSLACVYATLRTRCWVCAASESPLRPLSGIGVVLKYASFQHAGYMG